MKQTISKKPYCKVCHDAGKDEKMYTSHYVRSEPGPNGKVVCPTLLEAVCTYCSKQGHTVSRCPEIAKKQKAQTKDVARNNYKNNEKEKPIISTSTNSKKKNVFEYLEEDDVKKEIKKEKEAKKVVMKDDFPPLNTSIIKNENSTTITSKPVFSYANIAKKCQEEMEKEEVMVEIRKREIKLEVKKPKIIVAPKKKNWADYSDDEEEEEELMSAQEYFKEYLEEMPQNDAW